MEMQKVQMVPFTIQIISPVHPHPCGTKRTKSERMSPKTCIPWDIKKGYKKPQIKSSHDIKRSFALFYDLLQCQYTYKQI